MKMIRIAALTVPLLMTPAAFTSQAMAETFVTVQPTGQWLASQFIGQSVSNPAGERIGDINDLLFDKSGRIENVVVGVGGFLGIGEKNVAMPYNSLSITADNEGRRVVQVAVSKAQLESAPDFKATEKTVYMRAKERAGELSKQAVEKAGELKDKAAKKIDEMRTTEPQPPKN